MSRHTVPNSNSIVGSRRHTVAVVGVTGTIGSRVAKALADVGYEVIGLSRSPGNTTPSRVVAVDLRNDPQRQSCARLRAGRRRCRVPNDS